MNCNEVHSKLADVLLDGPDAAAGQTSLSALGSNELRDHVQEHLDGCASCRQELAELRATMAMLDTWEAPAPNPYFLTRLNARLDEERQAAPAGWFERIRARLSYGTKLTMRPVAAMAMTGVLLVSGGTYLGITQWGQAPAPPPETAVVHDLQTLDNNAQLLDQLEAMSDQNNNN